MSYIENYLMPDEMVLDYGTVYVSGTGGASAPFAYIKDPLNLRRTINKQI